MGLLVEDGRSLSFLTLTLILGLPPFWRHSPQGVGLVSHFVHLLGTRKLEQLCPELATTQLPEATAIPPLFHRCQTNIFLDHF